MRRTMTAGKMNADIYKKVIIIAAGIIVSFLAWKIICKIVDRNAFKVITELIYPVGELYFFS